MSFRPLGGYRRNFKNTNYGRSPRITRRMGMNRKIVQMRRATSAINANVQASRALYMIRKLKNEEEKKIHEVYVDHDVASGSTATTSLSLIAQSTTAGSSTTRIGNKISVQSLAFKGKINLADSETAKGVICRLLLVMDRRPQGTQATQANILSGLGS